MRQPDHWWPGHPALVGLRNGRRSSRRRERAVLLLVALALSASTATAADRVTLEYNRDVRPILAENCFPCHGPDSAARKADLRLDKRDAAIEAGAIAPGDVEASELIARINAAESQGSDAPGLDHQDAEPEAKRRSEAMDFRRCSLSIALVVHPARSNRACPACKNRSWVRNPIDGFVLAKLEENGLSPAPEADRRTLARRVSLDLTGLTPDPAEVESFVHDRSPDAYEKLVSRLLASPRWGEHRARYWLDAARYADTNGFHFDNFREAWAYRDWVIGAYNRNLPFDRFTIEQLAGDLLARQHARTAGRLGIQPLQHDHQRRRLDSRGIPGALHPRPHRGRLSGLARADSRLRSLPRPQVRPDHPARVLRALGVLQQHDAAGHGRQHQGHAADGAGPERRRSSCAGKLSRRARRCSQTTRCPQAVGPR